FSSFFSCYLRHRDLHSFPTRRSSDLIVDALLQRVEASLAAEPVLTVILGGGVARNRRLRKAAAERLGARVHLIVPAPDLCTDNRSEEHTSELQSRGHLVCRLLLEKKK